MGVQIFTHTETELSNIIYNAVSKALKENQLQQKPDNTILTQIEVAQLLKISIPTLQAMKEKGLIPFTKIQRKIYFKKQDVLTALETLCTKKGKG
jgi:excisionase family DNA binding protein